MKLYKDGKETLVDKSQLKLLLDAGWSTNKEDSFSVPEEEPSEEEIPEETKVTKPKKRAPKKISTNKG